MVKSVIFDIDNTLYDYDSAHAFAMSALEAYTKDHFYWDKNDTAAKIKAAYNEIEDQLGKKAAIHNRLIRFQRILENEGLPLYPHVLNMYDIYWNTLIDHAKPYKGLLEALVQLRKEGITIGIGTNMTSYIQFRKLTKLGLLQYFNFVVSSEEADHEKPEKEMFLFCAHKANCDPSLCLYIGDSLNHDIKGALNAGMEALWFRPDRVPLPAGATLPVDYVSPSNPQNEIVPFFTDYSDLLEIIQQINR
ncbi:MAG: HAD family hydrolase [Oscillospiraceae bacterium]|nr:HAD family hydrolase [Oscillospiraceae bacterium]